MTNASKYGILMHSVDNFIQVTVVRDTKEAATVCFIRSDTGINRISAGKQFRSSGNI